MDKNQVVFVRCVFVRGGFPSERIFIIRFEGGSELRGVAQVYYCYSQDRTPLGEEPSPGQSIEGLVLGIVIDRKEDETVRVQLPDGYIYDLTDEYMELVQSRGGEYVSNKS